MHLARGGTVTATYPPFWTAVGPTGGYKLNTLQVLSPD